ncbi:MAG: DSBA oxidoreductase family protein [Parcubacteria group bacterium GW2011_GWC2_42_6]|nr:MAG: DSBA oxidoreductase family protein [Parcubacteria group bacterium GW2011_GWC2_42_6]
MTDKKIIVTAVILASILIAGGWYYSKKNPPVASITDSAADQIKSWEAGITYGNPSAPLTVEEYTNFLCPACATAAANILPQLEEDYVKSGRVKIVFFIYPPFELSRAALCAQEQEKFIQYHDYLFSHQKQITEEKDIKDFAVNAGLDEVKFNECYDSDKFNDLIDKWYKEGQKRGIDSTPTFIIGGQKIIGAQPYAEIKKVIDEKLSQL